MKKICLLFMIATIATLCGCNQPAKEESNNAPQAGTEQSASQDPYVLTFTGTTIDGTELTSDCFSNSKLTMINVWGTFCAPCINEMPDLGELANEYDLADFQMYGIIADVTEDSPNEDIENAKAIIIETQADYPHILLNEALYNDLVSSSDAVPTTYFFNGKGELLGYLVGAQSKEGWKDTIDELLAQTE